MLGALNPCLLRYERTVSTTWLSPLAVTVVPHGCRPSPEFEELVEKVEELDVQCVLRRYNAKLVKAEVTGAKALQALTLEKLMIEPYGLSEAAAGVLKLAFPTAQTGVCIAYPACNGWPPSVTCCQSIPAVSLCELG
jgi:hypothetical protein